MINTDIIKIRITELEKELSEASNRLNSYLSLTEATKKEVYKLQGALQEMRNLNGNGK